MCVEIGEGMPPFMMTTTSVVTGAYMITCRRQHSQLVDVNGAIEAKGNRLQYTVQHIANTKPENTDNLSTETVERTS